MSYSGTSLFKTNKFLINGSSTAFKFGVLGDSTDFTLNDITANNPNYSQVGISSIDTTSTYLHYFFDHTSGTNIDDGSINNRDATIQNSGYFWQSGGFFSNTSNYLKLTETNSGYFTIPSATISTTMTFKLIFRYDGVGTVPKLELFNKKQDSGSPYTNDSFRLIYDPASVFPSLGNTLGLIIYRTSDTSFKYFYTNTTLISGQWYMLTVNMSLSSSGEIIDFVLNGFNNPTALYNPSNVSVYTTLQSTSTVFRINGVSNDGGSTTIDQKDLSLAFLYLRLANFSVEANLQDHLSSGFRVPSIIRYSNTNTISGTQFDLGNQGTSYNYLSLRYFPANAPSGQKGILGTFGNFNSGSDLGIVTAGKERLTLGKSGNITYYDPIIYNRPHSLPTPSGTGAFTGTNASLTLYNNLSYATYASLDFKLRSTNIPVASWIFSYSTSYQGNMILRMSTGASTSFEPIRFNADKSIAFSGFWNMTVSGHLTPALSGTYDIGTNSLFIRNVYCTNLYTGSASAGSSFSFPATENTYLGINSGYTYTGNYNVGVGYEALRTISSYSGSNNTCIGRYAGYQLNGSDNTIIGSHGNTPSLNGLTRCTGIGQNCFMTAYTDAVVVGATSGGGNYSVRVGQASSVNGYEYNTSIGYAVNTAGHNNTLIGYNANASSFSNVTVIGAKTATGSNQVAIGANNMAFLFSNRWGIDSSGHFYPQTTTTFNIGGTSNRVNNFYGVNSDLSGTLTIAGVSTFNGIVDLNSGFKGNRTAVNSNSFTILTSHYYLSVDTSTQVNNLYLPVASTCADQVFQIKDRTGNANTNAIIIWADNTQPDLIEGNPSYTINTAYNSVKLYSNGSHWEII